MSTRAQYHDQQHDSPLQRRRQGFDLSSPCLACGATTAFKRDSAGERVRVPALQIVTEIGCTLPGLPAHLGGPGAVLHLARVLGFETPAGVIE
jgi:hypothetical protein